MAFLIPTLLDKTIRKLRLIYGLGFRKEALQGA